MFGDEGSRGPGQGAGFSVYRAIFEFEMALWFRVQGLGLGFKAKFLCGLLDASKGQSCHWTNATFRAYANTLGGPPTL